LQRLSQSALVETLRVGNFKAISESLPRTIKSAINQPPIYELLKVTGKASVVHYVEFELIKLSTLISVGGNLNNAQVEFIAVSLVDMFPNESLADFKLAFERGCMGQYGEIYRMDGIVLRTWMEKYLDEKYQHVEADLMKYKESPHDLPINSGHGPGFELAKQYAEKLAEGAKIPKLTDHDIRQFGQEKPHRSSVTAGYKYFEVRGVQIYAITQEHAEELAERMIKDGTLIEVPDDET
jgi:hypothetical protein